MKLLISLLLDEEDGTDAKIALNVEFAEDVIKAKKKLREPIVLKSVKKALRAVMKKHLEYLSGSVPINYDDLMREQADKLIAKRESELESKPMDEELANVEEILKSGQRRESEICMSCLQPIILETEFAEVNNV